MVRGGCNLEIGMNEVGAKHLMGSLHYLQRLRELDISGKFFLKIGNIIGTKEINSIEAGLQSISTLQDLNLRCNHSTNNLVLSINGDGMRSILKNNTSLYKLQTLDLSSNPKIKNRKLHPVFIFRWNIKLHFKIGRFSRTRYEQ